MGNVTTNVWNARNELITQTLPDPDGSGPLTSPVWQWSYDANGNKLTQTAPMNRVTSWTWDKLDRMTQETLPDPDGSGPLTSPVIIMGYDNLGRKVSEQDPLGTTTWEYGNTDTSQVTSMTLPDPNGSGPLTSPVWTYSYDTVGRRYKTVDPMNHAQTKAFDADGRTTSVSDNLGHGPSYTYGHMGELLTTTDSLNHTTTDQYDSRFRLVQTTDANGGITQIQLDPAGNRVGLIDPDNNKTSWVFDALNRETSETNALSFTRSFSYDPSSDITSETDRDGRVRNFVFDNLHRLTAENWMNGSTVVCAINTAYNADNEVTSQSDPDSSYAFTFDNLGRTLTVDNAGTPNVPHVVLTAGYDPASDRTSLSATIGGTPDFLNSYTFDADQRLTDETQQGQNGGNGVAPKQIAFYYNALNQFTSIARYDFVGVGPMVDIATAAISYDGANRLTNLAYTGNGGQISIDSFAFTLDNANRVTARTSTVDGTVNYGYDPTSQVTSAAYTGGSGEPANEAYSYSKNGNRTNTGYSTGTNNQLLSDGTFNYQYDGEGNRTVRTRISNSYAADYKTVYGWDYRDRLTDVSYYDNNGVLTKHVHYVYDTMDHEIGKQVDDTGGGSYDRSEWYVLDVSPAAPQADEATGSLAGPLLQFDQHGNLQFRYFVGPTPAGDNTVYIEEQIGTQGQAGTEYFPLGDNENTPHEVVNTSSAVVDHIIANTFGLETSESNTSIHHWAGFEGGHFDPDTALTNDDHRWYDPVVGRWLSEDPLGFGGGDSNTNRCVHNSPTNGTDPSGLSFISNYWYYLWNPSQMDPGLQTAQKVALATSATAAAAAGGIVIAQAAAAASTAATATAEVAAAEQAMASVTYTISSSSTVLSTEIAAAEATEAAIAAGTTQLSTMEAATAMQAMQAASTVNRAAALRGFFAAGVSPPFTAQGYGYLMWYQSMIVNAMTKYAGMTMSAGAAAGAMTQMGRAQTIAGWMAQYYQLLASH